MQVQDIMTPDPTCCSPETPLPAVARMMAEHDCGEIPIVDAQRKPIGVITDRDIAIRSVAKDRNPLQLTARDCMSSPVTTVTPDTSVDDCCQKMEDGQIRRVPVVDEQGACCGMVSQADVAQHASKADTADVVREVSRPSEAAAAR